MSMRPWRRIAQPQWMALEAADECMGLPRSGLLSALSGSKRARGSSSEESCVL